MGRKKQHESDRNRRRREARERARNEAAVAPTAPRMRKRLIIVSVVVLALAAGLWFWAQSQGRKGAPVRQARIVATFPHDSQAFTQGLLFADGLLYESTGKQGSSTLRSVELETGASSKRVTLEPTLFGEGLALKGNRLVQLTWRAGRALVYDLATLKKVEEKSYQGEGWGLCFDGRRFILSDGTSRLRFFDSEGFEEFGGVTVRDGDDEISRLNELEWINGEVWANVWHSDRIARIDPASGRVNSWVDATALREVVGGIAGGEQTLNGIAHDPATGRIYLTGKYWPKLFEIAVD